MYAILKKEKEFAARENPRLAPAFYRQFRQSYTASQLIYPQALGCIIPRAK